MISCNSCGRQLPDGAGFCKFCGASQNAVVQKAVPVTNMRTMPEFVQEGKSSAKKNKKPIKTAVLIIVAVLLVIAIVATCIVIKNMPKTDEEKLRKILEESTTKPVIEMVCKDYDSDGEYEAYAIVSDEGEEGDKEFDDADIYFVNQKKAQKIKENVTGESNGVIVTDERIYISIEEEISDDESYSLVYTANGEKPAESEISGMYSDVHQEGGKVIATDDTGEEIVLDMPDGIRDIKSGRKNKKKPEKSEEPETDETIQPIQDCEVLFNQYVDENLEKCEIFPSENNEDEGVFSVLIDDFDSDGEDEMLTFSIMNEGATTQPVVVIDLYVVNNGEVSLADTAEKLYASGGGNFETSICATIEDSVIKIDSSTASFGYSVCVSEYMSYKVESDELVMIDCYYYSFSRGNESYEEIVSGTTYASYDEWSAAMTAAGYSSIEHAHHSLEDCEFDIATDDYKTADCFKGNHIFTLINSVMVLGEDVYGFIHDNTGFLY